MKLRRRIDRVVETLASESDKNMRGVPSEEAWEGKANVLIKFTEVVSFVWLRRWLTLLNLYLSSEWLVLCNESKLFTRKYFDTGGVHARDVLVKGETVNSTCFVFFVNSIERIISRSFALIAL